MFHTNDRPTIKAEILLDEPSRKQCGPGSIVAGRMVLRYQPPCSNKYDPASLHEFFGPLQVSVTLYGEVRITSKGHEFEHQPWCDEEPTYRDERITLFEETCQVYRGALRAVPGQDYDYPFQLFFPESLHPWTSSRDFKAQRESSEHQESLPPSFCHSFDSHSIAAATVAYRLEASVVIPNVDVNVSGLRYQPEVQYHPAPPRASLLGPTAHEFSQHAIVSDKSRNLPQHHEHVHGFTHMTKALLHHQAHHAMHPFFEFDVDCTMPRHLYLHRPMALTVTIKPDLESSTVLQDPEIYLDEDVQLLLVAHTTATTSSGEADEYSPEMSLGSVTGPEGPFEAQKGHSKTLHTKPFDKQLTPSFRFRCILREYYLRVIFHLVVYGQNIEVTEQCLVEVHLQDGEGKNGATSRSAALSCEDPPPAYSE